MTDLILENIELSNYGITYKINIKNFLKKTIIQDLKILLFAEYNEKGELTKRKKTIKIENIKENLKEVPEIILKTSKETVIGKGKINNDGELELTEVLIDNKKNFSDIYDLFELIPPHKIDYNCKTEEDKNIWDYCKGKEQLINKTYQEDEKVIKKKYLDNLFKIYYDSIVYFSIINSIDKIEGKASAMASYISIKNNLNEYFKKKKLNLRISNPNVFIKNINIEFDALIVNSDKENDYFYDLDDVKAIIEIKSSGFFTNKKNLILSQYEKDKEDLFISYIIKSHKKISKEKPIPYIYLSIYESFGQRKTSVHYYEFLLANILSLDSKQYIGMFCGTKKDSKKYLIPYDYDLDYLLKDIK